MSFSWKGLLGVNQQSSSSSSQLSSSNSLSHVAASPTTAALPVGVHQSSSSMTLTSPPSAGSSTMSPSTSRPVLNINPYSVTQPAAPTVPLFGGMIPSGNHHSTSFIPPTTATTPQSTLPIRKPSEIPVNVPEGGGYLLGMENFGNTCYVNSMLQSLYYCRPFRDSLLSYKVPEKDHFESVKGHVGMPTIHDQPTESSPDTAVESFEGIPPPETLFASLRDLFDVIQQSGQQKALASPTQSSAPGSLPPPSPLSTVSPSIPNGDSHSMVRKTSILGRATTSGGGPGRGGAGNHAPSASIANGTMGVSSAIPISAGSITNNGQSTLSTSSGSVGTLATSYPTVDSAAIKGFMGTLKRENVLFDSTMHQDAHEMLNFVLNKVGEDLIDADNAKKRVKMQSRNPYLKNRAMSDKTLEASRKPTLMEVGPNGNTCVHRLFEGTLTNETRCLTCETVTSRDECFLDLSIDIEQNSSITSCLRQFSASEMLRSRNKFFCDSCSGLQEAEKRMKIKKLPNVLALHLKRFKYEESVQRYVKLAYRVVFPLELRLFNTSDDAEDPDRLYELFAIVVHIGAGPHHGHYIAVVKVGNRWVQFDDDAVTYIDESEISKYYGDRPGLGSAYVLFYQAVDLDFEGLGLERPVPAPSPAAVAVNGTDAERGRMGLGVPDASAMRTGPSPDRSGGIVGRKRLGSVTEGSVASPTSAGPGEANSTAGSGWFGSFRNRDKRSGSQSLRRPKTTSSADPSLLTTPNMPSSFTSSSLAKQPSSDADGVTPDDASISTSATSANEAGAVSTASSSAAAIGMSTLAPAVVTSPSSSMANSSTTSELPGRATTESPSEAKFSRMMVNQVDDTANREKRDQNLLRGSMNRRLRAASEGMSSANVLSEAPINGHDGNLGGNTFLNNGSKLVSEPFDGAAFASSPVTDGREDSPAPAFSPLEKLASKKDQKSIIKNARRSSSHHIVGSPPIAEKKEGMLSNLFSSSGTSGQSKRSSVQQASNASSIAPSTAASSVMGDDASQQTQPSRKPSLSSRTLSKTFGFGRKS